MKVLHTTDAAATETEKLWIYNAIDSAVTLEVFNSLHGQLDNHTAPTYAFSRSLQGPVLDMSLTGVLVDKYRRAELTETLKAKYKLLKEQLNVIITQGLGCEPINPNSYPQIAHVLYDVLKLPPVRNRAGARIVNEVALNKLKKYYYGTLLCNYILELRDTLGKLKALKAKLDPDGRMRFSFSIAGTKTGRFSSYQNVMGTGMNGQNITPDMRTIFTADAGRKLAYIDLEQAESRAVGAILWEMFHDGRYLEACESDDLHTTVSKFTWDLDWTGDSTVDRGLASGKCYRDFSYRDVAKRLGHGTNYLGRPAKLASETGIALNIVQGFQPKYLAAFPRIADWHQQVAADLQAAGYLISLCGRKRWFHSRTWEDDTIREAVAYDPQSSVADILNRGLLHLWRANLPTVQLLIQVHDAILLQYDEEREDELLPQIMQIATIPVPLKHSRTLTIPMDAKVGWNWASASTTNPDGMLKYVGEDKRVRQQRPDAPVLGGTTTPVIVL